MLPFYYIIYNKIAKGLVILLYFIIVDDEIRFLDSIKKDIKSLMINNNYEYKVLCFSDYNSEFYKTLNLHYNKIYILDIEVNNTNGIDVARQIRKNSTEDYIIFLSMYENKYKNFIFKNTIRYYAFIGKNETNLLKCRINSIISEISNNDILSYNYKGNYYKIKKGMILYIQTDKSKKTIIKTDDLYNRECPFKLSDLEYILGSNFIRTSKFHLINKTRVLLFSFKNKNIVFDNSLTLDNCISRNFKKKEFEDFINNKE